MFAISITFNFSVSFLWQFNSVRLQNLHCVMLALSHVFIRRAAENVLSHDALVAGLTANSLQNVTASLTKHLSALDSFFISQKT